MVRAKVAAIGLQQAGPDGPRARALRAELAQYIDLADRLSRRGPALLVAMHGLPASGKTTVAGRLLESMGAVRVRSDVERKRLHGLAAGSRAHAAPGAGIYSAEDTRATYERLAEVARTVIAAGYPAIVDATFELAAERDRFRELAHELGAAFRLVRCEASEPVLRERIAARAAQAKDASDAGLAILEHRLRSGEPAGDGEGDVIVVDTEAAPPELDARLEVLAKELSGAGAS
jgi:predicted kinase